MEKKEVMPYIEKANEILHVLQKDGPKRLADHAVVISFVVTKLVGASVNNGEDKQQAIDAICRSIRLCCK